jgi:hypothetical protein
MPAGLRPDKLERRILEIALERDAAGITRPRPFDMAGYEPIELPYGVHFAVLTPAKARQTFNLLMDEKDHRKAQLIELLRRNGFETSTKEDLIDSLDAVIATYPTFAAGTESLNDPWTSIAMDAGLLEGDQLSAYGRRTWGYGNAAIVGMRNIENLSYEDHPLLGSLLMAQRAAEGEPRVGAFNRSARRMEKMA